MPFNVFPLDPFVDTVKEFIPHFLMPTRVSGLYTIPMQRGFLTIEGMGSGTVWPWIGEFMMMAGYLGIVIGPPTMAGIYVYLKSKLKSNCGTHRQYTLGVALLATIVGYYHYSRGYTPQAVKGYVFIILPYIILCMLSSTVATRRIFRPRILPRLARFDRSTSIARNDAGSC
jgi:hypothetical protein